MRVPCQGRGPTQGPHTRPEMVGARLQGTMCVSNGVGCGFSAKAEGPTQGPHTRLGMFGVCVVGVRCVLEGVGCGFSAKSAEGSTRDLTHGRE